MKQFRWTTILAFLFTVIFMAACFPKGGEAPEPPKPIDPPKKITVNSVAMNQYIQGVGSPVYRFAAKWQGDKLEYDFEQAVGTPAQGIDNFFVYTYDKDVVKIKRFSKDANGEQAQKAVAEIDFKKEGSRWTSYSFKTLDESDQALKWVPAFADTKISYDNSNGLPVRLSNERQEVSVSYNEDGSVHSIELNNTLASRPDLSLNCEIIYTGKDNLRLENPGIFRAMMPAYFISPSSNLGLLSKLFKILGEPRYLPLQIKYKSNTETSTYFLGYEWYGENVLKFYRFSNVSSSLGTNDAIFEVQFNNLKSISQVK